jgi:uncharacterized protein YndB with AHSA1/START domain
MKLEQALLFDLAPEAIWPWVADPDLVRFWNEHLETDTAPPLEALREGMEYRVRYRMRPGAQPVDTRATLERFDAPRRLVVRYSGGSLGREGFVVESIRLDTTRRGTRVTRTLDFHLPDIPLWARLLMSLVFRFGKPKGESDLEALRRVMREGGEAVRP